MHYNELTRRHFETASRAGELNGADTRRGAAGSQAEGTWVQFDLRIESHDGLPRVQAVAFLAYGCPHVIAVADWIAGQAVGGGAVAALPESVAALSQRFEIPVEKLGRLLIVEDAWIAAVTPPHPE